MNNAQAKSSRIYSTWNTVLFCCVRIFTYTFCFDIISIYAEKKDDEKIQQQAGKKEKRKENGRNKNTNDKEEK